MYIDCVPETNTFQDLILIQTSSRVSGLREAIGVLYFFKFISLRFKRINEEEKAALVKLAKALLKKPSQLQENSVEQVHQNVVRELFEPVEKTVTGTKGALVKQSRATTEANGDISLTLP